MKYYCTRSRKYQIRRTDESEGELEANPSNYTKSTLVKLNEFEESGSEYVPCRDGGDSLSDISNTPVPPQRECSKRVTKVPTRYQCHNDYSEESAPVTSKAAMKKKDASK